MSMEQSQSKSDTPKIAILHDALCVSGGAEKLTLEMLKVFPGADFFTSVYLPDQTFSEFQHFRIHTLPFSGRVRNEKQFKLLYPLWLIELRAMDFSRYDVVLSSSTYLAKYVNAKKVKDHRSYIHTPFRFLWKPESYSNESLPTPPLMTRLLKMFIGPMRLWDRSQTNKIHRLATNSQNMANAIEKNYHRSAEIIYPPIDVAGFSAAERAGDYYLSVSRLISHKRVDLAIAACKKLGRKLLIVGDGPERKKLEQSAGPNIHFLGRVESAELADLYRNARALLFTSDEDFGMVPVEAQASGIPVLAFGSGGALETVVEGTTGLFFKEQTEDSLIECIKSFESLTFNAKIIRTNAERFDVSHFREKIREFTLRQ